MRNSFARTRRVSKTAQFPRLPKADYYDHAPMESFFHTLKTEPVRHRQYKPRDEAQRDIFAFIECFYKRTGLHCAIGYIAPIKMVLKAA